MKINFITVVLKLAAAGMLIGAMGHHPYDYYTIMRWVVCGVSAFGAFQAVQSGKSGWAWLLAILALTFNPLIPVHLKRGTWAYIDPAVAALLLISIPFADPRRS